MNGLIHKTIAVRQNGEALPIACWLRPGAEGTIAYLHGLGSTKDDFLGALDVAGLASHTLLAFDFPGSGESPYPDGRSLEMDDLVDVTEGVLEAFAVADVTLIGHSMGGLVGLRYAERHPESVRRFVDVEGNVAPEDCGVFSRKTAGHSWETFVANGFMGHLRDAFARLPFPGARRFAETFAAAVQPRAFYDYCVSIVALSDSGTLMPAFTDLPVPRLFVHGEASSHLSYLEELSSYGIRVAEIPDSHHWPHFDNPTAYFAAVVDFIAET